MRIHSKGASSAVVQSLSGISTALRLEDVIPQLAPQHGRLSNSCHLWKQVLSNFPVSLSKSKQQSNGRYKETEERHRDAPPRDHPLEPCSSCRWESPIIRGLMPQPCPWPAAESAVCAPQTERLQGSLAAVVWSKLKLTSPRLSRKQLPEKLKTDST